MISRLFPAAARHIGGSGHGAEWKARWLRDRRVAHEEILKLYLERVAGKGLRAFTDGERAFELMSKQAAFDSYLRSLDSDRLEDVVASLEVFEDKFKPDHVVAGTITLLNLLPTLPERQRGLFEIDSRLIFGRVIYRLLRSLGNPDSAEAAVRAILPSIASLSSKLELITIVGYREGAGHKLVSQAASAEFERNWRSEVRAASPSGLAHERDLLGTLLIAKRDAEADEPMLQIPELPEVTAAIFNAARTETKSQTAGNRAIRRSPQLAWDALVELFGSQDELEKRVKGLKETKIEGELLSLVDKYLGGWRPKPFD